MEKYIVRKAFNPTAFSIVIHRIFPVIYITIKLHYCLEFKTLKLGDLSVVQWLFSVVTTYGIFGLLSLDFGVT